MHVTHMGVATLNLDAKTQTKASCVDESTLVRHCILIADGTHRQTRREGESAAYIT